MRFDAGLEVEVALTKALILAQKVYDMLTHNQRPALQLYTPHLQTLSARLAQAHQANDKLASLRSTQPYLGDAESEAESLSDRHNIPNPPPCAICLRPRLQSQTEIHVQHRSPFSRSSYASGSPSGMPTRARVPDVPAEAEDALPVIDVLYAGEGFKSRSGDPGHAEVSISNLTSPVAAAYSLSPSSPSTGAATPSTAGEPLAPPPPPPSPLLPPPSTLSPSSFPPVTPPTRTPIPVRSPTPHHYASMVHPARVRVLHAILFFLGAVVKCDTVDARVRTKEGRRLCMGQALGWLRSIRTKPWLDGKSGTDVSGSPAGLGLEAQARRRVE
ncbi:hypothetical protein H0H81_006926 [Sphagnurus paluster]|uniref:Uncharacterized protein n=1 Tax=Sphagnurus paluster TaxID=117069 RepID=A0A9P7FRD5_9AGAR|nr:hypothetical protein H0H81_006926 [Sphagnurus paluster]